MIDSSSESRTSVATNILFGTSYNLKIAPPLNDTTLNDYILAMKTFTQAILAADPSNVLVHQEVYRLRTGGMM